MQNKSIKVKIEKNDINGKIYKYYFKNKYYF